jgi:hypothetical protein
MFELKPAYSNNVQPISNQNSRFFIEAAKEYQDKKKKNQSKSIEKKAN